MLVAEVKVPSGELVESGLVVIWQGILKELGGVDEADAVADAAVDLAALAEELLAYLF